MNVVLDGNSVSVETVVNVARNGAVVAVAEDARERLRKSRRLVEHAIENNQSIYGVTTGIGEFARVRIPPDQAEEMQHRIVRSHAAGTGDPLSQDVVRAAMLLRANCFAKGYSAVRESLMDTLLEMINRGVVPYVYEKGSLGASGDLAPLAHMALVVIGEGRAWYRGELLPGAVAMQRAGLTPLRLTYKEGLGLINGTQVMAGAAALIINDAEQALKHACIAAALTLDALRAVDRPYDPPVHRVRPYPGQSAVAANLRQVFAESEIMANVSGKVQDGYSMRCTPQILGPTLDTLEYVRSMITIEMNSATDNPLFFPEESQYYAAGNFHGQGVGMVMDFLCIALAEVANLAERHINRLLNPVLSGLPDFLIDSKGLNSGLMVAQYTAAALVSENKVLSHPGSVDSISVSADQEDHVSMGPVSVRKCTEILKNVQTVLAIETLCACQALDFHQGRKPGRGSRAAHDVIRSKVPFMVEDRPIHADVEAVRELMLSGAVIDAVENAVGPLRLARDITDLPRPNVSH